MDNILIFASILAPVVLGLTEGFKKVVNVKNNYLPVVALLLGLLVGLTAGTFSDLAWDVRLWAGGLAGLSGVGLFELVTDRSGTSKENKEY